MYSRWSIGLCVLILVSGFGLLDVRSSSGRQRASDAVSPARRSIRGRKEEVLASGILAGPRDRLGRLRSGSGPDANAGEPETADEKADVESDVPMFVALVGRLRGGIVGSDCCPTADLCDPAGLFVFLASLPFCGCCIGRSEI